MDQNIEITTNLRSTIPGHEIQEGSSTETAQSQQKFPAAEEQRARAPSPGDQLNYLGRFARHAG